MPKPPKITKARLQVCKWDQNGNFKELVGEPLIVQFNPESLKISTTNQIANANGQGGAALQFSSRGTTKLSFELWFDVSSYVKDGKTDVDVRTYTSKVSAFMKPVDSTGSGNNIKYIPPGCMFLWGKTLFFGVMDSLNETLEYFSEQGIPLRASVSVSLTKQDVKLPPEKKDKKKGKGQKKLTTEPASLQQIYGKDWQKKAQQNKIEDPMRLGKGQVLPV